MTIYKPLTQKRKFAISEWEDLIITAGGFLAADKIAWCLADYKWIRGKWKCTDPGQDTILEATNKTREIVPLLHLKENEAMLMLGMYIAWDGNNKFQVI